MPDSEATSLARLTVAGFLAWLMPGLGHAYLGHRGRGLICFVTITATFWTGVAIGGVRGTIDPHERKLWFLAQLCAGVNTGVGYALHEGLVRAASRRGEAPVVTHWASAEVGLHYTGVAGLLNLLVVLDAVARGETPPTGRRKERSPPGGIP